jgi:hypothetical protein
MLPIAIDRAGTLLVGMRRISDSVVKNSDPVARCGETIAAQIRSKQSARAKRDALFKKMSAVHSDIGLSHQLLLEKFLSFCSLFCPGCAPLYSWFLVFLRQRFKRFERFEPAPL